MQFYTKNFNSLSDFESWIAKEGNTFVSLQVIHFGIFVVAIYSLKPVVDTVTKVVDGAEITTGKVKVDAPKVTTK